MFHFLKHNFGHTKNNGIKMFACQKELSGEVIHTKQLFLKDVTRADMSFPLSHMFNGHHR